MKNNIKQIRFSEKRYHDDFYDNTKLFDSGTWLAKPVKKVIDYFEYLGEKENLKILDLGCGVGRHCIPILQLAKERNINITYYCVDILDSAIKHLQKNLEIYKLTKYVEIVQSDIDTLKIQKIFFDYIISISCIEHSSSREKFKEILENIQNGTKLGGINCFFINSDVEWIDSITHQQIEPQIEVNFEKKELTDLFEEKYKNWKTHFISNKIWIDKQVYLGKKIEFTSNCFMFIAENKKRKSKI